MAIKYTTTPDPASGLLRITAARAFGTVKADEVGGLIESEANLSHDDLCVYLALQMHGL